MKEKYKDMRKSKPQEGKLPGQHTLCQQHSPILMGLGIFSYSPVAQLHFADMMGLA